MHSAIWRSTWHMSLSTLVIVAVLAFIILAWRRSRRPKRRNRDSRGYRYRSRYRK
ncbi:MAG: hypothetical protein HKN50_12785 [Gammaproteobacteria bacterium]|nr:hypothetical protein [Gammaproteobacteria bacterium]